MNEPVCVFCGKPPDVEITPTIAPLTAIGERVCELIAKTSSQGSVYSCVDCVKNLGAAFEHGDFTKEEP